MIRRLACATALVMLGACAAQEDPGYYEIARGNTESDARHRARGDSSAIAASQLQFGFGSRQEKPQQGQAGTQPAKAQTDEAVSLPVDTGTGQAGAPDTSTESSPRPDSPRVLAETRSYLGTVACLKSGNCNATRITITLAPDGQWRARNAALNGSSNQAHMGCWFLTSTEPVRLVLQEGEQPWANVEFIQSNVLRLNKLNSHAPVLESRLTRQADIDPIDELSGTQAQSCPDH